MAAKILTKADEAAIREMPDDWFSAWSLTYVKNPRYRCERLEAAGVLETRVVGAFPDLTTEFRKVPSNAIELRGEPRSGESSD